ncbi:hypothetical protein SDC9_55728 [bioreactor metagenome]|uniref:Uncharacterized protein n=1 Tax=bioreactor metagenome TaxID=1076179 RepID=A0A644X0K3_9ZZZZ
MNMLNHCLPDKHRTKTFLGFLIRFIFDEFIISKNNPLEKILSQRRFIKIHIQRNFLNFLFVNDLENIISQTTEFFKIRFVPDFIR